MRVNGVTGRSRGSRGVRAGGRLVPESHEFRRLTDDLATRTTSRQSLPVLGLILLPSLLGPEGPEFTVLEATGVPGPEWGHTLTAAIRDQGPWATRGPGGILLGVPNACEDADW